MKFSIALVLAASLLSSVCTAAVVTWKGPTPFHQFGGRCNPGDRWCLGAASVVRQDTPNANGGPQALEGYTHVNHQTGSVKLALGTLGNIELGGASGTVTEMAYALNGGLVVTGPGVVERAAALTLATPKRHGDYTGPINVKESLYIAFDNGWTIKPQGPDLLICRPDGTCRAF